jgi:hypothetical protein
VQRAAPFSRPGRARWAARKGSIPTDNPFFATASGANRAIWALGLRNPFTFAVQPGTGRIFINDVGESTWEEINDVFSMVSWRSADAPRKAVCTSSVRCARGQSLQGGKSRFASPVFRRVWVALHQGDVDHV